MSQRIVISYSYHMGKSGSIYLLISFFSPFMINSAAVTLVLRQRRHSKDSCSLRLHVKARPVSYRTFLFIIISTALSVFLHWLPHYSCNPCSTGSLARHCLTHRVSTQDASRRRIGWEGEKATGQRLLNCRSLSINTPLPTHPTTTPHPPGSGMTYSQTHSERKIQLRLWFRVRLLPLRGVKHHSRWIKPAKQRRFTQHIFLFKLPTSLRIVKSSGTRQATLC